MKRGKDELMEVFDEEGGEERREGCVEVGSVRGHGIEALWSSGLR